MNEARELIARMADDLSRFADDLSELRRLFDVEPELPESEPAPEQWLMPCQLAERFGISEAYTRKLIGRGIKLDLPGFEKRAGRLFATADAVKELRES